jgi:hypothetical protein
MTKVCEICGSAEFQIKSERFCSQKCIHIYGSKKAANNKKECLECGKKIAVGNFEKHLRTHIKKEIYYFCENCGNECFESYGSNRFCSKECARSFSTKEKRKEINHKVSKSLSKEKIPKVKVCLYCKKEFKTYKNSKYCSHKCVGAQPKKKGANRKKGSGGARPGGGRSKQISYTNWLGEEMKLNKEEIEVAKVLDQKHLNWSRNWKGFPYTTIDGKKRKFYPDFVIDGSKYIEYKGWLTLKMKHKMENAIKNNNLDLTIIIGNDPRYLDEGITLNEFYNEI